MAYESPITLIQTQTYNVVKGINEKTDEVIFKAVINVLPQVDKDELIKALAYDRKQYVKGYYDRDSEIVRCKDCKHAHLTYGGECKYCDKWENDGEALYLDGDFFCKFGERKGGDDE